MEILRKVSALPRGTALARYCLALGLAKGDHLHALAISEKWRDTPEVAATFKASVDPGSVVSPGQWGTQLAQYGIAAELIEALLPATVVGRLAAYMRRVPFRTAVTRETSVAASQWVEEGAPIPASDTSFDLVTQESYKCATIVVLSRDLLRFASNPRPDVEANIRSQLVRGIAQFFDGQFLTHTVAPSVGTHPGAITWNASAVSSTGSTAAQILADLLAMVAKLTTDNAPFQSPFWIMRVSTAIALAGKYNTSGALAFPNITANGGTLLGIPVITSANSPAQITLLDASEMLLSDDGAAEISTTDKAALQMADNPSGGAQSMTSLWQSNLWAIRAVREVAWQPAHFTGSVANSPIDFVPKCVTYMTVSY